MITILTANTGEDFNESVNLLGNAQLNWRHHVYNHILSNDKSYTWFDEQATKNHYEKLYESIEAVDMIFPEQYMSLYTWSDYVDELAEFYQGTHDTIIRTNDYAFILTLQGAVKSGKIDHKNVQFIHTEVEYGTRYVFGVSEDGLLEKTPDGFPSNVYEALLVNLL